MNRSGYNTANSTNDGESSLAREEGKSEAADPESVSESKSPNKTSRLAEHKRDLSE